jgi:cytochrome c oxidase subunit 2
MYRIDDRANEGQYTIQVYGKQWWWEVHYTEPDSVAGVVTANEFYIPVNTRVRIELMSSNVIHSFYVPQLNGKMDIIPGHTNVMSVEADKPGMYYGECTEFCGEQHAYMRFKIIAVPQDQFDLYIDGWKQGASSAAASIAPEGDVDRVPQAMALCLGCHRIGGVPNNPAGQPLENPPTGIEGGTLENQILGPNLSMFACRTTIAAGILPNTAEGVHTWLDDPGGTKPGNWMATMIKSDTLTEDQINQIVAYLETLHPDQGCPQITGVNADKVQRLADDPSAQQSADESTTSDEARVNREQNKS